MDKNEFVKCINALKSADDLQNEISELMKTAKENIENDFMNSAGLMVNHKDIVIELLEEIMEDKYNTVSWWIYETKYGKSSPNIYDSNLKEVAYCLDTPEKLYDYLEEVGGMEE